MEVPAMTRLAILMLIIASPLGCQNNTSSDSPKGVADRNNNPGGGVVQSVRGAPGHLLNANDLRNLHLFLESASAETGQLPDKQTIIANLKGDRDAAKLVKAIEDGYIVLTGNRQRESIWAYEKNADTNGGWVVSNMGPDKLSAAEVKKRLGIK
jgi:hypothetical protein